MAALPLAARKPLSEWSAWMVLAQRGDQAVYRRLLKEITPPLRRYVARRLPNATFVDDLCQDVLLKVHAYRDTYDARHKFEAWLFSIAANTVIDFLRFQGLRTRTVALEGDLDGVYGEEGDAEARLALQDAVAGLSSEQGESLARIRIQGQSVPEAAKALGTSPGAAKVRAHRAYQTFLDVFKGR
jgi:RNA polymerase sigma-70 factor (ECF subfamily)